MFRFPNTSIYVSVVVGTYIQNMGYVVNKDYAVLKNLIQLRTRICYTHPVLGRASTAVVAGRGSGYITPPVQRLAREFKAQILRNQSKHSVQHFFFMIFQ